MKITFLGAAGEVTGSQHLIETASLRILLDCGLFQGHRAEARAKNEGFRCDPKNLDAVILSHAHIDHSGNLPGLYRHGFRGPIFSTDATADVAAVMLADSARIQQEDARYLRRHLRRAEADRSVEFNPREAEPDDSEDFNGRGKQKARRVDSNPRYGKAGLPFIEPLYDEEHVKRVVQQFETLAYHEWHELSRDFRLRFAEAGHILGSAIVEMEIRERGDVRRVVFTGDLGRRNLPLLRDPDLIDGCDILISESTYGNRIHPPPSALKADLLRIIRGAVAVEGKVIIPAFSLGRTQQVIYFLNELTNEGLLPLVPVYVDSPLSNRITSVYQRHVDVLDADVQKVLIKDDEPFGFPALSYIQSQQESMALNRRKGPSVVIAASGMCENGRVLHHLKHSVADERNTIVIIGFQAQHTLGRRIVERQEKLRIFNRFYPLHAKVEILEGLSAHADAEDFKWWYEHLVKHGGVGQAFLVHGEPDAAQGLAALIRDDCDEEPIVPELYQEFEV